MKYDLQQAVSKHMIDGSGSEGSLGIVTKVSILTPAKLPSTNVAFLSCNDYMSCQVSCKHSFCISRHCQPSLSNVQYDLYYSDYCFSCPQKLLLAARRSLGEIISAFEFMDRQCIDLVLQQTFKENCTSQRRNCMHVLLEQQDVLICLLCTQRKKTKYCFDCVVHEEMFLISQSASTFNLVACWF